MNVRERNHVVPEMLSKSWTDETCKLRWYNKLDARRGIQHVTPRGAFWKKRLYVQENHQEGPDGAVVRSKDDWVEVHLGRGVEGPTEPVLARVIQSVRNVVPPRLTVEEREIIERFHFCQYTRTPNSRDSILSVEDAQALSEAMAQQLVMERGYPLSKDEQKLLEPDTIRRVHGNAFAHFVGDPDGAGQAILRRCGLMFLAAPAGALVIGSDQVAEFPDPDGSELGLGDSVAVLPIAPDVALAFGPPDLDGALSNFHQLALAETNRRIAAQSDSVAATSKELLLSLIPGLTD